MNVNISSNFPIKLKTVLSSYEIDRILNSINLVVQSNFPFEKDMTERILKPQTVLLLKHILFIHYHKIHYNSVQSYI